MLFQFSRHFTYIQFTGRRNIMTIYHLSTFILVYTSLIFTIYAFVKVVVFYHHYLNLLKEFRNQNKIVNLFCNGHKTQREKDGCYKLVLIL